MRRFILPVFVALWAGLLWACASPESSSEETVETLLATPPEIEEQLIALLETVDDDRPGKSIQELEVFLLEYGNYEIKTMVESEIDHFRGSLEGRYREARELARNGQFERAESMLEDLALLPETSAGARAAKHLDFEFYFGRLQRLLVGQRFAEASATARKLQKMDLTPMQADRVEATLDMLGQVDTAMGQAHKASAQAACRQLTILLETTYVEEGQYPSSLSLAQLEQMDPYGSRSIQKNLSAIESYRTTRDGFSFEAVSADGRLRLLVTNREIVEIDL